MGARWQLSFGRERRRRQKRLRKVLEAEARLHFDGSASESAGRLAKMRIGNDDIHRALVKVQVIEQVVEVSAKFELRVFSQHRHLG